MEVDSARLVRPVCLRRTARLPELTGRHVRMLFEGGVEGGLGIESGVHGDGQDAGLSGFAEALFRSCDTMLVNKVKEIATCLLIDDLGQIVGGNPHLLRQLR